MRPAASELIGRERELSQILDAIEASPAIVTIAGESGVGKTRIVREIIEHPRLRGRRILLGQSYEFQEPLLLGPIVEALRTATLPRLSLSSVAGALGTLVPELQDLLPPPPNPSRDASAERHRMFRGLLELFTGLGSCLLVVEDVHWADDTTEDLLRFLIGQLPPNMAVLLTYRAGGDGVSTASWRALASRAPRGVVAEQVTLPPLTGDEVRDFMASLLDADDVSEEFSRYLHRRTHGLPFAVEEVLRLLQERDDLVRRDGRWTRRDLDNLGVPAAIRDSVLERVGRLPSASARLLEAAAVIGVPTDEGALRTVAGLEGGRADVLDPALQSDLLREHGSLVAFRHPLAAEAVHEAIPGPRRRRMHLAAARLLRRRDPKAHVRLARHYREAGAIDAWVHHAEAGATAAEDRGDHGLSADLLDQVLDVGLSLGARVRLVAMLGGAALHGRRREIAVRRIRPLLEGAELPRSERGELRFILGRLLVDDGAAAEGLAEITTSVSELVERPDIAARAMAYLGYPWFSQGCAEEHLEWMDRAMDAGRTVDETSLHMKLLVDRAVLLTCLGDPRAWSAIEDIPWGATGPEERREQVRAALNLSLACLYLGHFQRAGDLVRSGRDLADRFEVERSRIGLEAVDLALDWHRGRWAGLEARLRRFLDEAWDVPNDRVVGQVMLGLHLLARKRREEAKAMLSEALGFLESGGDLPLLVIAVAGLARLATSATDHEAVLRLGARPLEAIGRKGIWVWAADLIVPMTGALVRLERAEEARELVERYGRGIRGKDAPRAAAAAALARAKLAASFDPGSATAVRGFRRAERMLDALPYPLAAIEAAEHRAEHHLTAAGAKGATELETVAARYRALGAPWEADRVRRTLRKHGIIATYRGGRRGYGDRLSPRELEVAHLAADGLTNRQISEQMFVSIKTVEKHLSAALRKLRLHSRHQLRGAELGGNDER